MAACEKSLLPAFIATIVLLLDAPVAQLDRVLDYESRGRAFESLRVCHSTFYKPDNGFQRLKTGELSTGLSTLLPQSHRAIRLGAKSLFSFYNSIKVSCSYSANL